MPRSYRENPRIDEGDISSLVGFALGAGSIPVALWLAPVGAIPLGGLGLMLGVWHASRGERPIASSLTVPLGLAGMVVAAVRLVA